MKGLPPLPPNNPPGNLDEDFPEYDAVPANLGPLIPGFIPIQRNSIQVLESPSSSDAPSDFLFNANLGFGLPTSDRVRKRNTNKIASVAMTNSHGGPIKGSLNNKKCQVRRSDSEDHIGLLQKTFPRCVNILDHCGIQNNDTKKLSNFGTCLNSKSVTSKSISGGKHF